MKWLRTIILINTANEELSKHWAKVHEIYIQAIAKIEHPVGSGKCTIRKKARLTGSQWKRNGVGYLKTSFLENLVINEDWQAEGSVDLSRQRKQPILQLYPSGEAYNEPITSDFGNFDFFTNIEDGPSVVIEWETGNISSSHRSLNKLAIALENNIIQIGVLIVPSRDLYAHLTDRIGNIGELSGYLSMWAGLKTNVANGILAITVVEHDALTSETSIPYLSAGSDGRAKEGRSKLPDEQS